MHHCDFGCAAKPQDVQEYRPSASRDPLLVTFLPIPFFRRLGFSILINSSALELLINYAIGMIRLGIRSTSTHTGLWRPKASCLRCLSWLPLFSMILGWIDSENYLFKSHQKLQVSSPQKLLISYAFLQSAAHYLSVYGIICWNPMFRLLRIFDSAKFLLKIWTTSSSMLIIFTFRMYTQNLEIRLMEPATKFCNWIRRSSWEYRYSLSKIWIEILTTSIWHTYISVSLVAAT